MAPRGHPRKPTNLRVLQGNPGKRPFPQNEPKPPLAIGSIKPPVTLNAYGLKMWKRLLPILQRVGLVTVADLETLAAACQSWGVWVQTEKFFKAKDPLTNEPFGRTYNYTNKNGSTNIIERPEVRIGQKALEAFKSFCGEFGLTPASRARIDIDAPEGELDSMVGLLASGK